MVKTRKTTIGSPDKKAEAARAAKTNRSSQPEFEIEAKNFDTLERLKYLPENWDSYGAQPPNQTAIAAARTLLERLMETGFYPTKITASVENGVALVFIKDDRYADIECFNDGEIAASCMDKRGVRGVFQIVLEDREMNRTIEQLSSFINE